ncbi:hypothetical protein C8J55DRAFT_483701 [Lentinula edodes]|uniref:Uncharacterized protein n=1 Tax=Lentinula lateritia TaxID=40482 RepID=A0A9W9B0U9_9AGAR|nr:hypothetical protein C8J55DRAFT_483701 [Lentinula edodes]
MSFFPAPFLGLGFPFLEAGSLIYANYGLIEDYDALVEQRMICSERLQAIPSKLKPCAQSQGGPARKCAIFMYPGDTTTPGTPAYENATLDLAEGLNKPEIPRETFETREG